MSEQKPRGPVDFDRSVGHYSGKFRHLSILHGWHVLPRRARKKRLLKTHWDAGEIGCGHLVMELHRRLNQMNPGDEIEIVVRDPGAPTDLPAWCRMTGHSLVSAEHPVYVVQRKKE